MKDTITIDGATYVALDPTDAAIMLAALGLDKEDN